jgi:hypothetical protein
MAKTCFKCKQTKPHSDFFRHSQTPDNHHSWCKICCREGNQKSRAKLESTIEGRARVFLRNARNSAIKRNQPFELETQDIVGCWSDQNGICAYSGRPMTLEANKLNTVSIERIDSSVGYTLANTILVCQAINRMKSDFSLQDFYGMCRDVADFLTDETGELGVEASK